MMERCKWAGAEEIAKVDQIEVCPKATELTSAIAERIGSDGGGALVIDCGLNGIVSDSLLVQLQTFMFLLFRWACKGLLFGTCENYWLLLIYFLLILLCSCFFLQISQMNLTFREIIHNYRKQPQCKPQIFRSVFIDWSSARRNWVCCSTCYSPRVSFCYT